ncbi:nuclear transport factor 2 family protein [Flavisolibacter sp. BT320]|nr:nuclear transport factor 2 family protein [Flavisolibacter longurius]
MKKAILILTFFCSVTLAWAQSRQEKELIERTYLLSRTVFGTKDSKTVEDLFAKKASYGHSSGKIETREEAIAGITGNKSIYVDTAVSQISVISADDDVAIVRHQFKANEKKADGTVSPLNLALMLVWVKEKGKWRLMGRQAVRLS